MLFDAEYRRGLEPSCRVCRDPSFAHKRAEWGCDEPVAAWDAIECFDCDDRVPTCPTCNGTRRLPLDRCPWSYVGPRERFVCEAAVMLEAGVSPQSDGIGWDDWPATFVDALQIVLHERAVIREKEQARAARRE